MADTLIAAEVEQEDFRKARGMIARLEAEYGPAKIESLGRWRQRLIDLATELKHQSQERLAAAQFRDAERLSRRMVAIWPDLPGAAELGLEIARRYPMVIVGVAEWPATRTWRVSTIGRRGGPGG